MVCRQCINTVKRLLDECGINYTKVELGHALIDDATDNAAISQLDSLLNQEGFQRIIDHDSALIENVKLKIISHIRNEENANKHNLSDCLADSLGLSYDSISRIFSAKEGRTIEKYYIAQKIELVKELLDYGNLTLSEIADRIGYSSVAHLSRQFKSVTGYTPSDYAKSVHTRKGLNEV